MHKSSDNQHKTDFINKVAKTIGIHELAIAIHVSVNELEKKTKGIISISDQEIEKTYQILCSLTVWEKSHV